jgi:hypothetical protein
LEQDPGIPFFEEIAAKYGGKHEQDAEESEHKRDQSPYRPALFEFG